MAIRRFLAMTASEIAENPQVSSPIAWMACHFSPQGKGLRDLPEQLPEGALLTLNDRLPYRGHAPQQIAAELTDCIRSLRLSGLLLDFQRPVSEELRNLTAYLLTALPCPTAVSEPYAAELKCPVFLPPPAPSVPLAEYFSGWKDRDIWLETGLDGERISLTEEGALVTPLPRFQPPQPGHRDGRLHCHYTVEQTQTGMLFTLWRTSEDLQDMLAEAEERGVTTAVGLWQELSGKK